MRHFGEAARTQRFALGWSGHVVSLVVLCFNHLDVRHRQVRFEALQFYRLQLLDHRKPLRPGHRLLRLLLLWLALRLCLRDEQIRQLRVVSSVRRLAPHLQENL